MNNILFPLFLLFAFGLSANAQKPYPKKHYNLEKSVAIEGYDPVSYFTKKNAEEGKESISYNHNGVIYYFASQEHKTAFVKDPAKYEPEYGGYCAYAMTDGEKVSIDPETFKIIDGKLYLFYNSFLNNTLKSWNKDEKKLLPKADKAWSNIIKN